MPHGFSLENPDPLFLDTLTESKKIKKPVLGNLQFNGQHSATINSCSILQENISSRGLNNSLETRITQNTTNIDIGVIYFNCQSVNNKIQMISQQISQYNPSIILLSETWIKSSSPIPNELTFNSTFSIFNCNRDPKYKSKAGGSAILISNSLSSHNLLTISSYGNDITITDIIFKEVTIRIICVYRPPCSSKKSTSSLIKILQTHITATTIIVGDFNAPSIDWTKYSAKNGADNLFAEFLLNFNFHQLILESTHDKGATLDLLLTNSPSIINSYSVKPGISDHYSIHFSLSIQHIPRLTKKIRDMSDKKLINLNTTISNFPFQNSDQCFTIDEKYNFFVQTINTIFDENLPEVEIPTKPSKHKYPKHINKALYKQRKLFHRSKYDPSLKCKYKEISKTVKYLIKQYHNQTINKLISSPQKLFSYMHKISKPQPPIPTLIVNDKILIDNLEKCNQFAASFSKAFNNVPIHAIPPFSIINNNNTITDIDFDIISVSNLLKTSPNKNSTSPDGIPFKFLRHCHLPLSPIITEIFRISLDSGTPPSQWKHSIVIPIYKKGNKHDVNNYRPISLTSTLSRTFERILASNILQFLLGNNLISEHQFGFLPKRSTTLQLLSTLQEWYNGLLDRNPTDCIYIDFRKAFDSVPHRFLLHKLYLYGIRGKIHDWISNFLNDRTFVVKIDDSISELQKIRSGVPQGSVIGPLLFILFINDLPHIIKLPVQIRLYADDVKLFLTHQSTMSCHLLQEALDNVYKWSIDWSLPMAPDKTTFIRIGTQKNIYPYHIGNTELIQSSSIRDLGIIIDQKLTFQEHISKIIKSAYFRSYQLLRAFKSVNPIVWAKLFKIYVLPILEYASEIWNPYLKESINKIEKVQKFYTRIALTKCRIVSNKVSYIKRLQFFKLQQLISRRKIIDLTTLYKICMGYSYLKRTKFLEINKRPSRKHNFLIKMTSKNSKTQNSFINRCIPDWNNLPKDAFLNNNPNSFKNWLTNFLSTFDDVLNLR